MHVVKHKATFNWAPRLMRLVPELSTNSNFSRHLTIQCTERSRNTGSDISLCTLSCIALSVCFFSSNKDSSFASCSPYHCCASRALKFAKSSHNDDPITRAYHPWLKRFVDVGVVDLVSVRAICWNVQDVQCGVSCSHPSHKILHIKSECYSIRIPQLRLTADVLTGQQSSTCIICSSLASAALPSTWAKRDCIYFTERVIRSCLVPKLNLQNCCQLQKTKQNTLHQWFGVKAKWIRCSCCFRRASLGIDFAVLPPNTIEANATSPAALCTMLPVYCLQYWRC